MTPSFPPNLRRKEIRYFRWLALEEIRSAPPPLFPPGGQRTGPRSGTSATISAALLTHISPKIASSSRSIHSVYSIMHYMFPVGGLPAAPRSLLYRAGDLGL